MTKESIQLINNTNIYIPTTRSKPRQNFKKRQTINNQKQKTKSPNYNSTQHERLSYVPEKTLAGPVCRKLQNEERMGKHAMFTDGEISYCEAISSLQTYIFNPIRSKPPTGVLLVLKFIGKVKITRIDKQFWNKAEGWRIHATPSQCSLQSGDDKDSRVQVSRSLGPRSPMKRFANVVQ